MEAITAHPSSHQPIVSCPSVYKIKREIAFFNSHLIDDSIRSLWHTDVLLIVPISLPGLTCFVSALYYLNE